MLCEADYIHNSHFESEPYSPDNMFSHISGRKCQSRKGAIYSRQDATRQFLCISMAVFKDFSKVEHSRLNSPQGVMQ